VCAALAAPGQGHQPGWFPHLPNTTLSPLLPPSITGADQAGASAAQIPGVTDAVNIAFGAPWASGGPPALYLIGTVGGTDGIWVSNDLAATWAPFTTPGVTVGDEPTAMEASPDVPGLVFIGTNGRGVYRSQ
jgi:hypothetical protein